MTHPKDAARLAYRDRIPKRPREEAVREFREVAERIDAAQLVQELQLADLAAGREPVESRVAREVEARRAVMARVTERVVGRGASTEVGR